MDYVYLAAGIAVLTGIGAAIGIGISVYGGTQAISRQPEKEKSIKSLTLLGMVLAEAIAIYGLLIALMLVTRGPTS